VCSKTSKEPLGPPATLGQLVRLGLMAAQVQLAPPEPPERLELPGPLELPELPEQLEVSEPQGPLARLVPDHLRQPEQPTATMPASSTSTTFAGETCQAVPASIANAAALLDGSLFEIDTRAGGGGSAGSYAGSDTVHCGGVAGGGGARNQFIVTRAELVALLSLGAITLAVGLGGTAGLGEVFAGGVQTVAPTGGGDGELSQFGPFFAYQGRGGILGTKASARPGGTGGGVYGPGETPSTTTARRGGRPAFSAGAPGMNLEGAGTQAVTSSNELSALPAVWGGASGAGSTNQNLKHNGGCSRFGGCGGGAGGGVTNTSIGPMDGGDGGSPLGDIDRGGGGLGGASSNNPAVPAGNGAAGADGNKHVSGCGGGGGGEAGANNGSSYNGGNGGAGGFPSGGAGGGGFGQDRVAPVCSGGNGAVGGDGILIITVLAP